jgi:hypothetical protein
MPDSLDILWLCEKDQMEIFHIEHFVAFVIFIFIIKYL